MLKHMTTLLPDFCGMEMRIRCFDRCEGMSSDCLCTLRSTQCFYVLYRGSCRNSSEPGRARPNVMCRSPMIAMLTAVTRTLTLDKTVLTVSCTRPSASSTTCLLTPSWISPMTLMRMKTMKMRTEKRLTRLCLKPSRRSVPNFSLLLVRLSLARRASRRYGRVSIVLLCPAF